MGQSGSKAARTMRLPRNTPTKPATTETANKMPTREQMLAEDTPTTPESPPQLQDNLKYFLNPKELQTPITPVNPSENPNVQALRNRRVEAENQVSSAEIAQMLRDVRASGPQSEAAGRLGAKYGLDRATVLTLNKYLDPADK